MQGINPPTPAQLLAIGQRPLAKFEIYVAAAWVNLCTLDAKNYVEGASVSLGGASMTPNPVAGAWDATIFNEDSIFHPQHPTSPYKDYLKTERLVRISVGATYGGVDYYWQRVIGYMDEPKFNAPNYRVSISGGDYMKRLQETELRMPDNYWGLIWTTSSIASEGGAGVEKYTNADAMRLVGEVNAVPNWVADECTFDWVADAGGTSTWVGRMITTETEPLLPTVVLDPVFVPVADKQYAFKFKYNNEQAPGVDASLRVIVKQQPAGQPWIDLGQIEELYSTSWPEITLYFTAQTNDPIEIWLEIYESPIGTEFRFDKFSIFEFVPYWERYYELRTYDANEKGVHHVTLTLINNGGFVANVNEWIAAAAVLTNVAGGQDGNCMQVASSGAALGKAYQDITTIIGNTYKLSLYFKKGTSATGKFMIGIVADEDSIYDSGALSDAAWTAYSHTFVATATTTRITMQTTDPTATENSLFDEIILGPEDVWQGEGDEGWYYAEDAELGPDPPAHPAGIVFFDPNKTVAIGTNNLVIYYYLQQEAEDVVARLLFKAGLYANEAAALAAITAHAEYIDPNVQIDKVWFKSGTNCLEAIKIVCERCDYRFYFDFDGTPVFRPRPTVGAVDFTFTDPKHIASINTYQGTNEIKNRIVIQGMRQAEPVNREETMLPKLKGEDSDVTSIAAYGERTLTIDNHLFQTQAAIDAMCTALLAIYKDPKWYSDLQIPFNPVPLVMGDTIQWEERLSPILNITQTGVIRDIKIDGFNTTYKCEQP